MPNELAGRADKNGNKFEIRWTVNQILHVLEEKIDYVTFEPLGDDERGIDLWVGKKDGTREGQQCKGRNASKENWDFGSANSRGIFENWKFHLEREPINTVSLVSPLNFTFLEDLIKRASNTNDKPEDFYQYQVNNASKEFKSFFKYFCKAMSLDPEKEVDLIRCISYLNRIAYRQTPDEELKNIVLSKISYLFIGNEEDIYNALVSWVVEGNLWGKKITQSVVYNFFREKEITLKNLALDDRIAPKIEDLNRQFKQFFHPLNNEMIERGEFFLCREKIDSGSSLIIHGNAGRGKSGCAEDIVDYCHKKRIPHLAIKLDKQVPSRNAELWGQELGLPASIAHCLHSISKTERAVLILDQLDALRWTQAHSRDAILVCSQLIREVELLNLEREYNISIVVICRSYDLENDNNIKSLFGKNHNDNKFIKWHKVKVNKLPERQVSDLVGNQYKNLTGKLKEMLRVPSNLYIWMNLDKSIDYNECSTASHLVSKWWDQISVKSYESGLSEDGINETKDKIIEYFDNMGRLSIPLNIMNVNKSHIDFLSSNGFIINQQNKVSFAHQSILDCFLAVKMQRQLYNNKNIIEVIGPKERQTPGRRYQVQMFLQNLIEFDSEEFLNIGENILFSEDIRYSVKFVFYEVLNQVEDMDENISNFILKYCNDKDIGPHIINNIVYSKVHYIRLLRDKGVLDEWVHSSENKKVYNLLISMSPSYDADDVKFMERYAFIAKEDDQLLVRCFNNDINQDSDEMFELRMKLYQKYPEWADTYFNFKEMFHNCEMRTIRLFAFLLEHELKKNSNRVKKYADEFLDDESEIFVNKGEDILDILLPFIPTKEIESFNISEWSGRYSFQRQSLERTAIEIIKKANINMIKADPEVFWIKYQSFFNTGVGLHNEIILAALYEMPTSESNKIINYISSDLEKNAFEDASGNGDELLLAKKVLKKHSRYCDKDNFLLLEKAIISYISSYSKELYKGRVEHNRGPNNYKVYWSFWGDLQQEILKELPSDRLGKQSKELLTVLERRFSGERSLYKYSEGYGGTVSSPVDGKKLNDNNWIGILTNSRIGKKQNSHWQKGPDEIIENSLEAFSSSFRSIVSNEPRRMINLVLKHRKILPRYIDSLFSGVAHSKNINEVPLDLLETMILDYKYNYKSQRASYICDIIMQREGVSWSEEILLMLNDIALNHEDPELGKPRITNNDDKDMRSFDLLHSNAINCVKGKAARAIGHLLWNEPKLFKMFRETIKLLAEDPNPQVKLATLFALWPAYNIERLWASEQIIRLYQQDFRLIGFQGSRNMFFLLYSEYRKVVLNIIKQAYDCGDKLLIQRGAQCLAEMYILKNEFNEEISIVAKMSKEQADGILQMMMLYFNKENYSEQSKEFLLKFKESKLDIEIPISRLFINDLIDLERDKEFLIEIMSSNLSRRLVYSFTRYLEKESKPLIDYKDIILSLSHKLISDTNKEYNKIWGIQDDVSKLIIGLYDEVSNKNSSQMKEIAQECLDVWDLMFEKQIGSVRRLSREMMQR